jgi:hypothetical protein
MEGAVRREHKDRIAMEDDLDLGVRGFGEYVVDLPEKGGMDGCVLRVDLPYDPMRGLLGTDGGYKGQDDDQDGESHEG